MSYFLIAMIYLTVWWLALFVALPVGVTHRGPVPPGHDTGAPDRAYLGRKLLAATLLALPATWLIVAAVENRWIVVMH